MKFITLFFVLFIVINNIFSQDQITLNKSDTTAAKSLQIKIYDSWTSIDKGQHFMGSLIGTILVSKVNNKYFHIDNSNSKRIGLSVMFSVGLTKELLDCKKEGNIFSWKDLTANVAGILAGLAIMEIK
jgi:uncharacterized protein YfiM (DUF2279 family)